MQTCQIARSQQFSTEVILRNLHKPTGIHLDLPGNLYYSEVPTPGVGGGNNRVLRYNLNNRKTIVVSTGEPDPSNISSDLYGSIYWTCKTANVILRKTNFGAGTKSAVLQNLHSPLGIDVPLFFPNSLVFTEVPTPGVPGSNGGQNRVVLAAKLLNSYFQFPLSSGEPEPSDVAVGLDGTVYWTCKTAGVVLMRNTLGQISLVEDGLESPTGLDIDLFGRLYWTEVPTPGVSGANGGRNRVVQYTPRTGALVVINSGDPEPRDVAVSLLGDKIFWTCTSAGVIVRAKRIR